MHILNKLTNLKLTENIRTDQFYFLNMSHQVFLDMSICAVLNKSLADIMQHGFILFSSTADPDDPHMQTDWIALKGACDASLLEITEIILQIPVDVPFGQDLQTVLEVIKNDCSLILAVINEKLGETADERRV